jgi:hypothetical protein
LADIEGHRPKIIGAPIYSFAILKLSAVVISIKGLTNIAMPYCKDRPENYRNHEVYIPKLEHFMFPLQSIDAEISVEPAPSCILTVLEA